MRHERLLHEELTEEIPGAAIEVHRALGPGLLESTYEACLCHELRLRCLEYARQEPLPLRHKGTVVEAGYRPDVLVEQEVIVELKSVEQILPVHEAQLLAYMRLSEIRAGLLMSFHVARLMDGARRRVP